jgi:hypothetical protein
MTKAKQKKHRKNYRLLVEYPADLYFSDRLDAKIEEAVGRGRSGSGMGCGVRDMDFDFYTRPAFERAVSRLKSLSKVHKKIKITTTCE